MSFFGGGFPFGDFFGGGHPGRPESNEPVDTDKYYNLLGVEKSMSCADIKKAFRRVAITKHPDKGGDPSEFAEITHAAEILTDPEKRKVYDTYGEKGITEGRHTHEGGGGDIFDLLMGGRRGGGGAGGPRKGEDVDYPVKVTLEEIYNGATKKIAINRDRTCVDCNGLGGKTSSTCQDCGGRGMVKRLMQLGPGMYSQSTGPCDKCRGSGKAIDKKDMCKKCKGKQVVQDRKVIEVPIDKGVPNGHRITFHGESDERPGILPGDLIVHIQEKPHDVFKRKKADLIITKKITLKEALTGFSFSLKHLDGAMKVITCEPGEVVKQGDVKTVIELGMPLMRTPFKFGNLFISFEVEFPDSGSLSPAALQQLREILPGPEAMEIDSTAENHKLIGFDKSQITENSTSIHSDYNDDDERGGMGGQRVECRGTIF